jgi:hypothetical protein
VTDRRREVPADLVQARNEVYIVSLELFSAHGVDDTGMTDWSIFCVPRSYVLKFPMGGILSKRFGKSANPFGSEISR